MAEPPLGKLLDAEEYAARHDGELGFEAALIQARQNCNLRFLAARPSESILEVGCGPFLLAARAAACGISFGQWAIVEPAQSYAAAAAELARSDSRVKVVRGYLEESATALESLAPHGFDTALVSSVLHETTEPERLLEATVDAMRSGGQILVNVPNAFSFHRLLAVKMGLISAPDALTERNRRLGQPIVYGPQSLRALVHGAGLVELRLEGYLFKPFTNEQMARIASSAGEALIAGLEELGRDFPEHAAEICITATKP
jgi:SAM-dependent methyltransferase